MRLSLTGDVMLGRLVNAHLIQDPAAPPSAIWADVLPLLREADCLLMNLECVISSRGTKWRPETKAFHFRAGPRALEFLQAAGTRAVSLANNHILDYGVEALADCLALLDRSGIKHAGAGLSSSRPSPRPWCRWRPAP